MAKKITQPIVQKPLIQEIKAELKETEAAISAPTPPKDNPPAPGSLLARLAYARLLF